MKALALLLLIITTMATTTIFDFTKDSDLSNWRIVDDVVMGGRSNGYFSINEDGHAIFRGKISLENNGGFSSVRYDTKAINVTNYTKVCIRLKGDGKPYQFRVKADSRKRYSYITSFETSGTWETITIDLKDLYPAFRGRTLDYPNFDKDTIDELAFLIGNKKEEAFELLIDKIELQ
ncbi:CIA30 family protein [Lacinutrix sp. Hel_I_90]|uniref:CIA30 family protein n=1 Tax=Lacinutrix sp. Hel_I_90 TaxID=1249999 RepID=UPI0005CA06F2|nr:CIA30 family protein [Lacinutrix sp. Hel_I_90]